MGLKPTHRPFALDDMIQSNESAGTVALRKLESVEQRRDAAIERQMHKLELAVAEVEQAFAVPSPLRDTATPIF